MKIIIRAITMFVTLFVCVKILGKKQMKNLTLYDYILSITIGSIAADTIISLDTPLYDGILALLLFTGIGFISSVISYHNHSVEEIMGGEPLILYENNSFNYQNLNMAKLTIAKLLEYCRLKGCFNINELETAILETSGDVSILLKEKDKPITSNTLKRNIQKKKKNPSLSYSVIIDGILNEKELKNAQKTKNWLKLYLKENHLKMKNIALLSIDKAGNITVFNN